MCMNINSVSIIFSEQVEMEADEEEIKLCAEILENWNTPTPIPSQMLHQNPFSQSHTDVEGVSKHKYKGDEDNEIIPVLVADTFYDKLLGHAADGIDIAALVDTTAGPTTVSATPNQQHQLSSCFKNANTNGKSKRFPATIASACTQLDFVRKLGAMLYSNKTISTDDFGEKMWRNPGVDTTDFFNYGLDEKLWENYCKQMHTLIHEPCPRSTKTNEDTHTLEDGEIAQDDSFYEIEIRTLHTNGNGGGGANLVSNSRNKQHRNRYKM